MVIRIDDSVETELRRLATRLGRDVDDVAMEAIRTFILAESVVDLSPEELAQTQAALMQELPQFDSGLMRSRGTAGDATG